MCDMFFKFFMCDMFYKNAQKAKPCIDGKKDTRTK